jgi:uncharacterized membrane protein
MQREDWRIKLIQLLSVGGILVAYYLLLFHNGVLVASCGSGGWDDCGIVSGPDAPYSSIGPIPVALIGLLGYAIMFLMVWLKDWWPLLDDYLPELMLGITSTALLFTLGLTALELFVIHAVCSYCLVSAIIVLITFLLSVSYVRNLAAGGEA